MREIKI